MQGQSYHESQPFPYPPRNRRHAPTENCVGGGYVSFKEIGTLHTFKRNSMKSVKFGPYNNFGGQLTAQGIPAYAAPVHEDQPYAEPYAPQGPDEAYAYQVPSGSYTQQEWYDQQANMASQQANMASQQASMEAQMYAQQAHLRAQHQREQQQHSRQRGSHEYQPVSAQQYHNDPQTPSPPSYGPPQTPQTPIPPWQHEIPKTPIPPWQSTSQTSLPPSCDPAQQGRASSRSFTLPHFDDGLARARARASPSYVPRPRAARAPRADKNASRGSSTNESVPRPSASTSASSTTARSPRTAQSQTHSQAQSQACPNTPVEVIHGIVEEVSDDESVCEDSEDDGEDEKAYQEARRAEVEERKNKDDDDMERVLLY